MNLRARKYLDVLGQNPELSREKLEQLCGYGKGFAERWARTSEEFREEEKGIRSRWKIAERRRKAAARAIEANEPMPGGPAPMLGADDEPLSRELERFLVVFAEEGAHRSKTIARCKEEGYELEWEDVEEGMRDRRFSRRFSQIFERALVLVEDEQIAKGKKGTTQSALAVLKAHKPGLYGNNMKLTVSGGIQLTAADRGLVEDAKGGAIRKFRDRAERSAGAMVRALKPVTEEILEVEYSVDEVVS